jgi:hypothetical protein
VSAFKPIKQTARLSFLVDASTAADLKRIEDAAKQAGRELALDEYLEAALKKLLAAAKKELLCAKQEGVSSQANEVM